MAKKQQRDNAYYEQQLRQNHPTVYADFLAGKYQSLSQARIAAGIKKPRTRLHELKNAWQKASPSEQQQFLHWLQGQSSVPSVSNHPVTARSPVTADRKLEPWAVVRIAEITKKLNLAMGGVMQQMGCDRLDTSLASAVRRGTKLRPQMVTALEQWLKANEKV